MGGGAGDEGPSQVPWVELSEDQTRPRNGRSSADAFVLFAPTPSPPVAFCFRQAIEFFQRVLNITQDNGEIWGALGES